MRIKTGAQRVCKKDKNIYKEFKNINRQSNLIKAEIKTREEPPYPPPPRSDALSGIGPEPIGSGTILRQSPASCRD